MYILFFGTVVGGGVGVVVVVVVFTFTHSFLLLADARDDYNFR